MTYNYRDDPILGSALAYWIKKRSARLMPCKRDIDPTEIPPKVLPNLQIIDVIDGGARFRYRLVGTALVDAYGSDFSGKYLDEMFLDTRLNFVQSIYRTVAKSKMPLFSRNKYHTPKNVDLFALRVCMPLSNDDWNVHHILGVLRFEFGAYFDCGIWGEEAKLDLSWRHNESITIDSLEITL
jgi:hypothetical protein